ncbi:MAG: 4-alpha-glucanotransferase [Simkaniaceae bacterium]
MKLSSIASALAKSPCYPHWQKIGIRHHHGIDLPLFSLHSKYSAGIGEFPDLIPVIDWLSNIGMDILQLLPLNDSAMDPSPYNALSAFALHPIYLGLANLPYVKDDLQLQFFLQELQAMNHFPKVSYHDVLKTKQQFLLLYFQRYFENFQHLPRYQSFLKENSWLKIYALFKALKDHFSQKGWFDWPEKYKNVKAHRENLISEFSSPIAFYEFVQYLCFQQLHAVKEHAEKKGVFLKGDIPILISPDSADVWHFPEFFDMSYSAGAPPDMFNPDGQYWGFPTYKWNALRKRDFNWWKKRLRLAEKIYHIYRIDHVIGFYRIWEIPRGDPPGNGRFVPKKEDKAIEQGEEILTMMLRSSSMLPIAEDLGFITEKIRESLKRLGIAGTRVIRWEKTWDEKQEIIPTSEYEPLNLTTVSTHDSETLELWWRYRSDEAKDFAKEKGWHYIPDLSFDWRFSLLRDSHTSSTLFHINLLQEYFGLYPELSWPNPEDERINIPGFLLPANWTYRFRPSIEEFTSHAPLFESMKELIRP